MLKRVTSTIFLLVFTVSIVGRTMERTEAWVSQHALNSKHSHPGKAGDSKAELHKQAPRQSQTRLSEDGSVLDISFVRSLNAPPSIHIASYGLTEFVADPNERILSSRAPPTFHI
jgi:hypothetical protein